jgi:hypothetical protein
MSEPTEPSFLAHFSVLLRDPLQAAKVPLPLPEVLRATGRSCRGSSLRTNPPGAAHISTTTFSPRGRFRVRQGCDSSQITINDPGPNCPR